eukprot:6155869-Amphidinium_carterae.1
MEAPERQHGDLAGFVAVERKESDLPVETLPSVPELSGLKQSLVCPGDVVTAQPGTLRGRGIMERHDGCLVATYCGVLEQVNKLLYIKPLKNRYVGSIGDVVVGRVLDVQAERWTVDIGTAMHSSLHLT